MGLASRPAVHREVAQPTSAVLTRESHATNFLHATATVGDAGAATPTLVEASMLSSRIGRDGPFDLERLLERTGLIPIDVTADHTALAAHAVARYGRGSGHRARLDLGDCAAYVVASVDDEPLSFTGDASIHTDVRSALGGQGPSGPGREADGGSQVWLGVPTTGAYSSWLCSATS